MILDAISSASGTSSASSDSVSIADDFDTFLQILTTQLQNQNPLEPLDTNEFTSQLVEFSQVEQQIKQNENLEAITQLAAAAAATNAVSFVGKRVSVETTLSDLTNGSAMWHYDADESTDTATFTIRNSDGEVVWNSERSLSEGDSEFVWDGRDNNGVEQPDGTYSLSIEAYGEDSSYIGVSISADTTIDGVDFSGDEPLLLAGDTTVSLATVKRIYQQ